MAKKLSHYDEAGRAQMVDVSAKAATKREAEASAFVEMSPAVLSALPRNPKGGPLEVARLAGIMAAKDTPQLIPMCPAGALSDRYGRFGAVGYWGAHASPVADH